MVSPFATDATNHFEVERTMHMNTIQKRLSDRVMQSCASVKPRYDAHVRAEDAGVEMKRFCN